MAKDTILGIAKKSIEELLYNNNNKWIPNHDILKNENLDRKQGVFVTLYEDKSEQKLRGCIGIPFPKFSIGEAIAISARDSASKDPRFKPVSREELSTIHIVVEILSEISPIVCSDLNSLKTQIKLGQDGLIVKYMDRSGLLLPDVPVKYNWDVEEYIYPLLIKARIHKNIEYNDHLEFFRFTSIIYK